jgi:gamma-tubulin complex component 2
MVAIGTQEAQVHSPEGPRRSNQNVNLSTNPTTPTKIPPPPVSPTISTSNQKSQSFLSLQFNHPLLLSHNNRTVSDTNSTATLDGYHLSQTQELLTIHSREQDKSHLHYNDNISFVSANLKALGVKNKTIGFFRSVNLMSQAETWTVLPPSESQRYQPVRSGDKILLQNELTGGLLSFDGNSLVLRDLSMNLEFEDIQVSPREIWNVDMVHTPPKPEYNRPFLNATYLNYHDRHDILPDSNPFEGKWRKGYTVPKGDPLNLCSIDIQDKVMVEEILGALMGLEGTYIKYTNGAFEIVETLDLNISHYLEKMLDCANSFVHVNAFVAQRFAFYENGTVSHALCGAIHQLLREYILAMVDLDDRHRSMEQGMTVNSVFAEIRSASKTILILHKIVDVANQFKGGALLNALEDLKQEYLGDANAGVLFSYILEKTAIPYFDILRRWVEDGTLKDPYGEFMIEETGEMKRKDINTNILGASVDQWGNWFSLRDEHVLTIMKTASPSSHGSSHMDLPMKILTTGKYWNATMLCQNRDEHAVPLPSSKDNTEACHSELVYGMNAVEISRSVNRQYEVASRTLLNIFMRDYRILDVLAFMKRYFLLDQGDFFVHFLDMAEDELLQEMTSISRGRVQNWMALSIQMSGGNDKSDGFHDDSADMESSLTGTFALESLINHLDALHASAGGIENNEPKTPSRHAYGGTSVKGLTGMEAFMLDFQSVPFPISLILSRHSITNYQLMFRHLFFAKHVERRLVGTWLDHQVIKEYQSLRADLGRTYFLRQRMLHFMQNFVYYMMFEVIEPNWLRMKHKLTEKNSEGNSAPTTVDNVLKIHNDFVVKTLKECLLTNRDLVRTLTKLMTTCLLFSDQMKLFMDSTGILLEQDRVATESRQKRNRRLIERSGEIFQYDGSVMAVNEKREKKIRDKILAAQEHRQIQKQKQTERLKRELNTESYKRMILRFEQVFNLNLSDFMKQLRQSESSTQYHTHLANLCMRLDYNGYVTKTMEAE